MRIKDTYILKNIAGSYIVVPIGSDMVDFNGMITLNESGALLWETLKEDKALDDLVSVLIKEYDVASDEALADAEQFVKTLKDAKIIED